MPDASRISLRKGLRRLFGARGWTEFLKSLIKLAAVIAVATMMLIGQKVVLLTAMDVDPGMLPQRVLDSLRQNGRRRARRDAGRREPRISPGRGSSGGATTA